MADPGPWHWQVVLPVAVDLQVELSFVVVAVGCPAMLQSAVGHLAVLLFVVAAVVPPEYYHYSNVVLSIFIDILEGFKMLSYVSSMGNSVDIRWIRTASQSY